MQKSDWPAKKKVLAVYRHGCTNYIGDSLEEVIEYVQDDGNEIEEYQFFDIELGVPIEFEMKPLRKEVPVRKVK